MATRSTGTDALDPMEPGELFVPASTSNLGPGFDCLGLALNMGLWIRARRTTPAENADWIPWGRLAGTAADWTRAADNLFLRALEAAWRGPTNGLSGWKFDVDSEIPLERGFGSSGAAVAAGLLLGSALSDGDLQPAPAMDLLPLGVELEGHPDNVAPALFGGCVLAHARGTGGYWVRPQSISEAIGWSLAWPERGLDTRAARGALPRTVAFEEALWNPPRLALLLEGLRLGDGDLLSAANEERLHVPYRLPLIEGGMRALAAARNAGAWLATISGAGSGLIALGPPELAAEIARTMERALGPGARSRVVAPFRRAPSFDRALD